MFGRNFAWSIPICLLLAGGGWSVATAEDSTSEQVAATQLTAARLFPLAQDAEWHFTMHSGEDERKITYQAAKLESQDDELVFRVDMVIEGKIVLTEHLSQTPEGLYRNRFQDAKLSPPLLLLKNPIKPGDQWTTKTQIGAQELTIQCKVDAEEITVPAGKYDAVKLAVTTQADGDDILSTYWFAPDVGIVRQDAVIGGKKKMYMELTSHEPGPASKPPADSPAEK